MKQNAAIEHLKQKKTMTPAEREENQRFVSLLVKKQEVSCFGVAAKLSRYYEKTNVIFLFFSVNIMHFPVR